MLILGIDTSCDDTSISIVENGTNVITSLLTSQTDVHAKYSGVVPELAARAHLEMIFYLLDEALTSSSLKLNNIDAIAVTNRPGLIGSLLVGVGTAKGLAFATKKPIVAIEHIAAHIYSVHLTNQIEFPYIAIVVSGGHTIITKVSAHGVYEVVGTTLDDAVGEAYDKIAKHLGLGYPGGPVIDKLAKGGRDGVVEYPVILLGDDNKYNFSYSGLKTAAIYQSKKYTKKGETPTNEDIALAFQKSAVEPLYKKALLYSNESGINRVTLSGGVAANSWLREKFSTSEHFDCYLPELRYTSDNAAMVAGLAYYQFDEHKTFDYSFECNSRVLKKHF